jgi:hypothetical protein
MTIDNKRSRIVDPSSLDFVRGADVGAISRPTRASVTLQFRLLDNALQRRTDKLNLRSFLSSAYTRWTVF